MIDRSEIRSQPQNAKVRLSNAQIGCKVSFTPKSRLSRNNRKTYYNTFAASAVLAFGQPSQEAPRNMWPTNWWIIFRYFLKYCLKSVLFGYLVNSMQNQLRSTSWPPLLYMKYLYFESPCSAHIFLPLCNSITRHTIALEGLFKPTKNTAGLLDCIEKILKSFGFCFFVGDVINEIGFRPFWLRLPGPGPQHLEGIFWIKFLLKTRP